MFDISEAKVTHGCSYYKVVQNCKDRLKALSTIC